MLTNKNGNTMSNAWWFMLGVLTSGVVIRIDHPECIELARTFVFPVTLLLLWLLLKLLLYLQQR